MLVLASIALPCVAFETYLRIKWPFLTSSAHTRFHAKAGNLYEPNSEVRWSAPSGEYFATQRANSLGFLDREPPSLQRAAASCHISFIGDSFVDAKQVPIADKSHVQLERIAAEELPHLKVTTSAFGRGGTAQIHQLPYYDEFVRQLRPRVLVLVFTWNDFGGNHPALSVLQRIRAAWDPAHPPYVTAEIQANGTPRLRAPDPNFSKHLLPQLPASWKSKAARYLYERSYLAKWLYAKVALWISTRKDAAVKQGQEHFEFPHMASWLALLTRRPRFSSLAEGWSANKRINRTFESEKLPPAFQEAVELTAFALDEFKKRAERDAVLLAILATHSMGTRGDPHFDRISALAAARDIPVIDYTAYVLGQGGRIADGYWKHDRHWNAMGHQWAAEAVLEFLKEHAHVCYGASARDGT